MHFVVVVIIFKPTESSLPVGAENISILTVETLMYLHDMSFYHDKE